MQLNRREFIGTTTAGAAGLTLSSLPGIQASEQSREIDELFDRSIIIDTTSSERWDEAGFAAWKASGYTAILSNPNPFRRPSEGSRRPWSEGNFEVAMEALKQWQQRFGQYPDRFIHCTRASDIERAKRESKLAVILGFQNAPFKDDVGNVERLYQAGCRSVQLTYNSRNNLGDGCTERLQTGLSDFGIACVERMNELGMIADLSHCGEGTTSDGIAFSRYPACTHTFCQALHFHPRGKSDALLRALADKGGIAGICMVGYFLTPNPQATLEDYINHLDHAVNVCGIDHVGMSTDFAIRGRLASSNKEEFMRSRTTEFKPNYNPRWAWASELDRPDRYRTVAHTLARRGYKTGDIEKLLGGNWLRYFREVFRG